MEQQLSCYGKVLETEFTSFFFSISRINNSNVDKNRQHFYFLEFTWWYVLAPYEISVHLFESTPHMNISFVNSY